MECGSCGRSRTWPGKGGGEGLDSMPSDVAGRKPELVTLYRSGRAVIGGGVPDAFAGTAGEDGLAASALSDGGGGPAGVFGLGIPERLHDECH